MSDVFKVNVTMESGVREIMMTKESVMRACRALDSLETNKAGIILEYVEGYVFVPMSHVHSIRFHQVKNIDEITVHAGSDGSAIERFCNCGAPAQEFAHEFVTPTGESIPCWCCDHCQKPVLK